MVAGPPAAPATEPGGVLRASAQISAITAAARIAGFARWIVLGLTVGTTYLGNTYQTANWVPNVVFELVAGGILSAVFVPTFVAELEHGRDRGLEVASSLANAFLLLSIPVVLAGIFFARPIMAALTIGVADAGIRAREIELGAWFLRFFVPQIPLYVIAMVLTGVLHAHRRFVVPAAAPLFSSLIVIGTYLAFDALGPRADLDTASGVQLWVLAGGTTGGVFVLAFSQLPSVLRLGVRWRPVLRLGDPAVRRAIKAGGWGIGFFAVTELGLLVTLILANRVEGGVVGWQVAYAFFELPNALIGLPVAIALFPNLAQRFVRRDGEGFARLLSTGFRTTVFLAAPAAAGLFVLAPVLSEALLARAGPTGAGAELVGATLRWLALGIPAWVLVATLTRTFYARHETAPPVGLNAAGVAVYAAAAIPITLLVAPAGPDALRILGGTFSAGQWTAIAVGTAWLASRVPGWRIAADVGVFAVSLGRAAIMGAVVWFVVRALSDASPAAATLAGVVVGALVYIGLSLRSAELRATAALVRGMRGKRETTA